MLYAVAMYNVYIPSTITQRQEPGTISLEISEIFTQPHHGTS